MRLAINSSGLILLGKADILREVCLISEIMSTHNVRDEVIVGLEKGRKDALYTKELIKEGKIKIVKVKRELAKKFQMDFNLGEGEASVIALCVSEKDISLVTDDNKCRKVAKALGINVVSSLDFPIILYKKGIISYEKAKISLEILKKEGWFSESVIINAFKALDRVKKR